MDSRNSEAIFVEDWRCPACNADANSSGVGFVSSRAVALHVAGKLRTGDHTHRKWAQNKIGDLDFYAPINQLGSFIEPIVVQVNRDRALKEIIKVELAIAKRQKDKKAQPEDPGVAAYRLLSNIEKTIHEYLKDVLVKSLGESESEWWAKGVPYKIRSECVQRKEQDTMREEPYSYVDLTHLREIIEFKPNFYIDGFSAVQKKGKNKQEFLSGLSHANEIRRRVMHTIRAPITDDDITFLEEFSGIALSFCQVK
jgi:hypothetical protein